MEINGKKVVDAKKAVKIRITTQDVTKGANKNPSSCAAALAAKRDIPQCVNARVHIGRVYVETPDKWIRYFTPESLRSEIIAFDRGGSFEPGDYELKAPSKHETEAGRKAKAAAKSGSETNRNNNKKHRKALVAKIKRHEVAGVRPKGAAR